MGEREIAAHRQPDKEERGQGRGRRLHEDHDELVAGQEWLLCSPGPV
jgi:hypothetical protein